MSDTTTPEYRTGFDEAPSTFNQEDAAPADYPPLPEALCVVRLSRENVPLDIAQDRMDAEMWAYDVEPVFTAAQFRAYVDADRAQRSGVSADPLPDRVSLSLGPVAFQFTSHQQWVNKAQSWFANLAAENPNAARKRYLCIDAKGRVCMIGKDFERARDEDAFPVKLYLIDAAQQHQVKKGEPS